jgi:protein O-GlcNAc transferase
VLSVEDQLKEAENLAVAGKCVEAAAIYEELLSPGTEAVGDMLHNLVSLYLKARRPARALAAARSLVFFAPQHVRNWMVLSAAEEKMGHREAALAAVYRALELNPLYGNAHISRLWHLTATLGPLDYRAAAEEWYQSLPVPPSYAHEPAGTLPGRRLRVGYVSGDFREHVFDRVILPTLEHHDRSAFDLWCFDNSPTTDAQSERMRSFPGVTWRYIKGIDDEAAAEMIHRAGIDILVDMNGMTAGNRLGIFMRRPAPLQITGQGCLQTTGATCFDWRIDDVADQEHFTERLWRLPSMSALGHLGADLPVTPLPAERNGFVTFGCVNGLHKLTTESVREFISVLKAVPGSRLVLMILGAADEETAVTVLRRFDPVQERVVLTEAVGGKGFCKVFADIDIALDPRPYGGSTTSFDTLFHGVPIVCRPGDRRIAADAHRLMQLCGVKWKAADYVGMAVEFAGDIPRLAYVRKQLRWRLINSAAGDPKAWVRTLEHSFQDMWRLRWQEERKAA